MNRDLLKFLAFAALVLAAPLAFKGGYLMNVLVFVGICGWVAWLSSRGVLPRTRKVRPGELAVSD